MSYCSGCGLSGLSIKEGDKAYFIFMSQSNIHKDTKNHTVKTLMNVYEMFEPEFFPILGEYDGYSGLVNIESSFQTKDLEEKYGYTIEELIEHSARYGEKLSKKENFKQFPNFAGMFLNFDLINQYKNTFERKEKNFLELVEKEMPLTEDKSNDPLFIYSEGTRFENKVEINFFLSIKPNILYKKFFSKMYSLNREEYIKSFAFISTLSMLMLNLNKVYQPVYHQNSEDTDMQTEILIKNMQKIINQRNPKKQR